MLRIGKLTDYALLIMSQMAKAPESVLSATLLAEALHLQRPTVSKILKILSDAHLVSSVRGAEGGYHLARQATEITIAHIIAAMEGEVALTECSETIHCCAIESMCTMKKNWKEINKIVQSILSKLTILDMLQPLCLETSGLERFL